MIKRKINLKDIKNIKKGRWLANTTLKGSQVNYKNGVKSSRKQCHITPLGFHLLPSFLSPFYPTGFYTPSMVKPSMTINGTAN